MSIDSEFPTSALGWLDFISARRQNFEAAQAVLKSLKQNGGSPEAILAAQAYVYDQRQALYAAQVAYGRYIARMEGDIKNRFRPPSK